MTTELREQVERGKLVETYWRGLQNGSFADNPSIFYDDTGQQLYQEILASRQYYLPQREERLFADHSVMMAVQCRRPAITEMVELGAGERSCLSYLVDASQAYEPVTSVRLFDCNEASVQRLGDDFRRRFDCQVEAKSLSHVEAIEHLRQRPSGPRLIALLGHNFGNFSRDQAIAFLRSARSALPHGGAILLSIDCPHGYDKSPRTIAEAYDNEPTANFIRHGLERVRDLPGGDIEMDDFEYRAEYQLGQCCVSMSMVACRDTAIRLAGREFWYYKGDAILMEESYRYTANGLSRLVAKADIGCCGVTDFKEKGYMLALIKL